MRLSYLSHRWPAKAQESLHICAVSPQPSLFAHIKYGSRQRVQSKIRHLAPWDGWACAFQERVYRGLLKSTVISCDGSLRLPMQKVFSNLQGQKIIEESTRWSVISTHFSDLFLHKWSLLCHHVLKLEKSGLFLVLKTYTCICKS